MSIGDSSYGLFNSPLEVEIDGLSLDHRNSDGRLGLLSLGFRFVDRNGETMMQKRTIDDPGLIPKKIRRERE